MIGGEKMGNASLGVRMVTYRARHRLSMRNFAEIIDERLDTIYKVENGIHKPHKANEIRLTEKMDKLEAEEKRG
jgi:DNA-binding XRE family transcriptional regulator